MACAAPAGSAREPRTAERHFSRLNEILSARLRVPIVVDDDRAAAWGEFRFGAGIGSGAVLDGSLWRGAADSAGELGHTQVVLDGLGCSCGARGCLDQYASSSGLRRRYGTAHAAGVRSRLDELTGGDPEELSVDMIAAAANAGDALARWLWTDTQRYLALVTANYVTLLNPEVLVLAGEIVVELPELIDEIAGSVLKDTTVGARAALRIERARLGKWAGVLGAAALDPGPSA